jgi:hypothetical protein
MSKARIALTNDWELRGNGLGSVLKLQYEPTVKLMRLYKKLGVNATFTIEVMQQLAFLKYAGKYPEIQSQAKIWEDTVLMIEKNGFDAQLHIHPQWHNAEYDGHFWKLDKRWNIADYSPAQIDRMFSLSLDYLRTLLPGHSFSCFRAGSWAVCPSRPLFETMEKHGIKLDVSVVNDIYYSGESVKLDYTNLESPYAPYYPDYDDARKLSAAKTGIVEIPTQSVKTKDLPLPQGILQRLTRNLQYRLFENKEKHVSQHIKEINEETEPLPEYIVQDPFGLKNSPPPSSIIIDLGWLYPAYYWSQLIEITINRAFSSGINAIVFENHPKDLMHGTHFTQIEKIISHIQDKYKKDVEFVTLGQLAEDRENLKPVMKNDKA